MLSISESVDALSRLGRRLRSARLSRGDSIEIFGQRLGVSPGTIRAMEAGRPTVAIGTWANAFWAISRLEDLDQLLTEKVGMFDEVDNPRRPKPRQRAPRRKAAAP